MGGLAHFFHPAQEPVVTIAVLADRYLKFEFVIAFIGLRTAQIPCQPRPAHHDAGKAPIVDILFGHNADIAIALFEDAVFGQQGWSISS